MKVPYWKLIIYGLSKGYDAYQLQNFILNEMRFPFDRAMYIRYQSDISSMSQTEITEMSSFIGMELELIKAARDGFGREQIFHDIVALKSSAFIKDDEITDYIDYLYGIDYTKYAPYYAVLHDTSDFKISDWNIFIKFARAAGHPGYAEALSLGKFSTKRSLLFELGIDEDSVESQLERAVKKTGNKYIKAVEGSDKKEAKTWGELYSKLVSVYVGIEKKEQTDIMKDIKLALWSVKSKEYSKYFSEDNSIKPARPIAEEVSDEHSA